MVDFKISLTNVELHATDDRHKDGYFSEVTEGEIILYKYAINPNQNDFDINTLLEQIKQDMLPTLTYAWENPDFESYLGSRWEQVVYQVSSSPTVSTTEVVAENPWKTGGINLNPASLDLQIKRDANWVPLPMDQQPILDMKIDGFSPVIINVTPVNVPLLLGLQADDCSEGEAGDEDCLERAAVKFEEV